MRRWIPGQARVLLILMLTRFFILVEGDMEPERPYYIRPSPAILLTQPLDGIIKFGESLNLTCKVMGMDAIISGWWPHIYWRHNGSTVNSTWPENVTVDTNYWDMTTLHTPFPGTYQCVVDDGSFVLASRLATVKEGSMREWLNGNFRMECGKGVAESKWYKDGITLDGQSSRTVIVTNETRDPFGLYTCKADDVIGQWYLPMQASKENTIVFIDGNPSSNDIFVSHTGDGMTTEDITLHCNITVQGEAVNMTWFHNGEENVNLSETSIHFPTNSNVSIIAGTYVCAASTDNWEARVQFRIMLKNKLNPQNVIHSTCVGYYPEINAQNLQLTWNVQWYTNGIKQPYRKNAKQLVVISRQNFTNETLVYATSPSTSSKLQTLRLDSEYCITLVATAGNSLPQYFTAEGNSTLHHCNGTIRSCSQVPYQDNPQFSLSSDDTVSSNCGELQSEDMFMCTFMWQQPTDDRPSRLTPDLSMTCPDENLIGTSSNYGYDDRVITASVTFQAADCLLDCQVSISVKNSNGHHVYSRSGKFTPHSTKLMAPTINCSTLKGKSSITIEVPQTGTDRIRKCMELDANNNSNINITVFANESVFTYPIQLYEILKIDTTDITNGSNANTTVSAVYSMPTTGTSKNSTELKLEDNCPCVTGWTGSQCSEAICTIPCQNGGTCSQPDTCTCTMGWCGTSCSEELMAPTVNCSTLNGKSNFTIKVLVTDKISKCMELDANNTSNITVTVFANDKMFTESAQLNETIKIDTTDITSGSNASTTVFVMYSRPTTGTSKNSTAIKLEDTCPCVTGWAGIQCSEAICTIPCQNGGTCSQPDTCTCAIGWSGSICSEVDLAFYLPLAGSLLLLSCIALVIGLCLCYKCRSKCVPDLTININPDYYLELASVAECDKPTVCEDVDIEKWVDDITQEEDTAVPETVDGAKAFPAYI